MWQHCFSNHGSLFLVMDQFPIGPPPCKLADGAGQLAGDSLAGDQTSRSILFEPIETDEQVLELLQVGQWDYRVEP